MKKLILSLAIVTTSFGAFAIQTPAPAKKVEVKTEKKASHKAKKVEAKKDTAKAVVKSTKPKKG
jgi:hypothetical protein